MEFVILMISTAVSYRYFRIANMNRLPLFVKSGLFFTLHPHSKILQRKLKRAKKPKQGFTWPIIVSFALDLDCGMKIYNSKDRAFFVSTSKQRHEDAIQI